jgi:hypothetical protein
MKKFFKFITIIFLAVIIVGAGFYMAAWYYITPERLRGATVKLLQDKLKKHIAIKNIHVELFDNPYVVIDGVEFGSRDEIFFSADSVRVNFSKWKLLFGIEGIKFVELTNAYAVVHIDKIKKSEKPLELPLIKTTNASAILYYKDRFVEVANISGAASSFLADVTADALSGNISVSASKSAGVWNGEVRLKGIDAKKLDSRFAGLIDGDAVFSEGKDKLKAKSDLSIMNPGYSDKVHAGKLEMKLSVDSATAFSKDKLDLKCEAMIKADDLFLPWGGKVRHLEMESKTSVQKDSLFVKSLDLKSNLIDFTGSGNIEGLSRKGDMKLEIKIKSDEFDYEPFVDFLPVKEFPAWLIALLTKQARKGRVQLNHAVYAGYVKDFKAYETCIRALDIELGIDGLTFSARKGNIIRGIKGTLVTKNGDFDVLNITGVAGGSKLKSVTLRFPATHKNDFRIGVEADLDMEAADFIQAWRAGVVAMNVNKFLDPVNALKAGRLTAKADLFYEEKTGGARIRGNAVVNGLDMSWDKEVIRGLSGTLKSRDYFKPVQADMKCTFNDMPVDRLSMSIDDIFNKIRFTYDLKLSGIPGSKTFSLNRDTVVNASGSGMWPNVRGNLNIETKDFTLYGTELKPNNGSIIGSGAFTAKIGSGTFIDIPELDTAIGDSILKTAIHIGHDYMAFGIDGRIDLASFELLKKGDFAHYSGIVDGNVSFKIAEETHFFGNADLKDVHLEFKGKDTRINGSLAMNGKELTLKGIHIIQPDLNALATGTLIIGDNPEYRGDLALKDIKLENTKHAKPSNNFNKLKADIMLDVTDMTISGIKLGRGKTHALIDKGVIKLLDVDVKGYFGSISGSAMIPPEGLSAYDLNFTFVNTPIEDFVKVFTKDKPWLTGKVDMSGRIWNSGDSLNGDIKFKAINGVIDKYNFVSRIFSFLNPYKIIKTGDFDLADKGFPYNHISATFTIRDSIMTSDDFFLDSNSVQVSSVGKYVIRTNYVDMVMGIQPLETFDKAVGAIPIVGWVLTGEKGTLIVISVRVRGPVDDTSVRYLPAGSLQHPVEQSLLRVLKLPVDLLTKPQEVILPGSTKKEDGKEK